MKKAIDVKFSDKVIMLSIATAEIRYQEKHDLEVPRCLSLMLMDMRNCLTDCTPGGEETSKRSRTVTSPHYRLTDHRGSSWIIHHHAAG